MRDGVFKGFNRDGSFHIGETGGGSRSLPADQVYVEVIGPRGGRTWQVLA